MMLVLYVVFISLLLSAPVFVQATGNSPTNSQASTDFDWLSYLSQSPEHSVYNHGQPASAQLSPRLHHQDDNQPALQVDQFNTNNKQGEDPSGRNLHMIEGESANVNYEQLFAERERLRRLKVSNRSQRYRTRMKEKVGFTSLANARLSHFRSLEKTGQISQDQQIELNGYREKMRSHMKTYKLKKKNLGPVGPKLKRGRPPILKVPNDPSIPKRGRGRPPKVKKTKSTDKL
ncbi:uncharacterized protein FA14DRAFT_181923 [Meira miltonrushii]|uniref:BZIP domain-containing protein n=1 Tax=Meira miltonrushii TaxID=1280837 RepID=A0A316V427_9BASI|nr:uncharacterized protein FA14DRAFT_181923 [Meira miltonrushii]PWN32004.1 hypothetical protein FA14DRAFT_181923 [Meira miltonrushii]